jgi:hypothetical protein
LSRPCCAIFDPIDRALGNAGSLAEIGLAPAQHGPAGADLGGKELPLVLNTARRHIYFCVLVHESSPTKNPRRKNRRGSSNSYLDQAIRAGSRGERER